MYERLNTDIIKYNSQLNESNSIKIPFKTINDFIANTLLEERERKVIPMWNTINNIITQNKV